MSSTDKDPLWVLFAHLADVERALVSIPDHAKWTESLFESDPPPAGFDFHPESNRAGIPQPEHLLEKRTRSMECAAEHFDRFQVLWDLFDGGLRAVDAVLDHLPQCTKRLNEESEPLLRRPSTMIGRDVLAVRSLLQKEPIGTRPPDTADLAEHTHRLKEPLTGWIDLILGAARSTFWTSSASESQVNDAVMDRERQGPLFSDRVTYELHGLDTELQLLEPGLNRDTWKIMRLIEAVCPSAPRHSPKAQFDWSISVEAESFPTVADYFRGLEYEAFKKRSKAARDAMESARRTSLRRAGGS